MTSWLAALPQKIKAQLRLSRATSAILPLKPGLYSYEYHTETEHSRIHLRIEEDLSGILLVNASRVFHLNPSAAWMAYLFLENVPPQKAVRVLHSHFGASRNTLDHDYTQFAAQLQEVIRPEGACPIHDLDLEITAPFHQPPTAPYRTDLALTYRCNNDCSHCYNARPRNYPESDTATWFEILDKLWQIGVPHVVFTGGEPTLREDLPQLIAHAQRNGQIVGLNTNGRRLAQPGYIERLVEAGLDHVQITLESHDPLIHNRMVQSSTAWSQTVQGIRNAVHSPLYLMTNTTLLQDNASGLAQTLDFLADLGVPTVGLNALIYSGHGLQVSTGLPEEALPPLLSLAREKTTYYGQKLIWYTPTQYCHFDPVQLELGVKGCTAALYSMCIEPNGEVIPCQSYYQPLGRILQDEWSSIWNHPLAQSLRLRTHAPQNCRGCLFFQECGGGCPLRFNAISPQTIPILGV